MATCITKGLFVGDYIDRGPAKRQTPHIIRRMQESGNAFALLGNHEYNALAYAYVLPDGTHLHKHNKVHNHQHEQTLVQFKEHQKEWKAYLEWFYTLLLDLELSELRAVLACWDEQHIQWFRTKRL